MPSPDTNETLRNKLEDLLEKEPDTKLKAKIENLLAPEEDHFNAWLGEVEQFNTAFCTRFNKRSKYTRPNHRNFHITLEYTFNKVTVNITAMETVIWVRINTAKLWSVVEIDYDLKSDKRLPIKTYLDLIEGAFSTLNAN